MYKHSSKKLEKFIKPMLAREVEEPFDDKEWMYEIKWDGYRAISEIDRNNVKLYSRNGLNFTQSYPVIVEALQTIKQKAVLDGEIVIVDADGKSNFQKLQKYEPVSGENIRYYAFDILSLNGKDTCDIPLIDRKKLLHELIKNNTVIKYSDHVIGKGINFFKLAGTQGLEGIMAKDSQSLYKPGVRSSDWLKIKHHKTEDVIVVGYTKSTGSRKYFGALVLAVRDDNGLKYAGHTGSGFTDKTLQEIHSMLSKIKTTKSPFAEKVKTNMPVTWVKPKFVCEVTFTEWTTEGKMRHPIFLQMRKDKLINDVVMKNTVTKKNAVPKKVISSQKKSEELQIGRTKVKITNRDKIYWPKEKITKGMMIDYYQQVADYILPYLKDRPESLKRNPNGIIDKGFYHKDAGEEAPSWVKSIPLFSESAKKDVDYILCNSKATLAYLNNLGCIELNPWNSTVKQLDKPDYMIIDIDPSEKNTFEQVIKVANVFHEILIKAGVDSYCKTSGATGLHIFVPMGKQYPYEQVRNFCQIICQMANEKLPAFTSMERNLKKRGDKKIYLDYLQNSRGQTIAAAYSLRPHKGATVSTPLLWKEVKPGLNPAAFNINTVPARIKKMKDIFKPVLGKGIDIRQALEKLS